MDIRFRRKELIYSNALRCEDDVRDFRMEGPGTVSSSCQYGIWCDERCCIFCDIAGRTRRIATKMLFQ